MSTPQGHDDVMPGPGRTRRGSAVAVGALTAVLLMGIGLGPAAAGESVPGPGAGPGAPAAERMGPDVAQRLAGVAQDLAEAVTHGEITEEQARMFLGRMCARLAS